MVGQHPRFVPAQGSVTAQLLERGALAHPAIERDILEGTANGTPAGIVQLIDRGSGRTPGIAAFAVDQPGPEHVERAIEEKRFHVGATMSAKDGRSYTIDKLNGTVSLALRRTTPKLRGKAARKAEKRARRNHQEKQP